VLSKRSAQRCPPVVASISCQSLTPGRTDRHGRSA
jgi:hypothetical protein